MDQIMSAIAAGNGWLNGIVWGIPALVLLMGAGIILTVGLKGFQFRKFGYAMKNTIGKMFDKHEAKEGEITPFQALTTALAATVGTGNIAGITTAVTLGGAGSIFWLWISALLGMATKYSEVLLSVKFREKNANGDWVGGPMYYIKNGLGKNWKWLGVVFGVFGGLASFGIGNAVQVGNITDSINTAIQSFVPSAADHRMTINVVLAVILMIVVGIVLIGGIKRIGAVTEKLIPFMSIFYILFTVIVIGAHWRGIGNAFGLIFSTAFTPQAMFGATTGIVLKQTVIWGLRRSAFSNEAGLGSAAIAHAAADTKGPVNQGLYGIFEVFIDTIVICSLTALTIICSGVEIGFGVKPGSELITAALATVFGDKFAALFIAIALALFAFSTVLGWSLYGTRCVQYLFGHGGVRIFQVIFILVVVIGCVSPLELVWDVADTFNGLMAIPNFIGLFALSGVVAMETRNYFSNKNNLR